MTKRAGNAKASRGLHRPTCHVKHPSRLSLPYNVTEKWKVVHNHLHTGVDVTLMLTRSRASSARHDLWKHGSRLPKVRLATSAAHSKDRPKVVFSGIQPTGVPHLGNYLGALQQWVKLQDEASHDTKLIYSIVDLHAITVPQGPEGLRRCKRETLATLLAVGLKPERSTIFYQSSVHGHT